MKKSIPFLVAVLLLTACSKSSDGNNPPPVDKSANLLATGASAHDILSNTPFTNMLVEVTYVQNYKPTQESMDNFVTFLQELTFKQNIAVEYTQLPSPGEETLTLQEIADLENENRTAYNDGTTLAIYIYFADAPSDDDDAATGSVTLGAVYRNTSMVIHEATVRKLAGQSALVTLADVESATLEHEFGHLFGLVDLGTTEINPHEDPDSVNHCDVPGCLMRAELQFGSGIMGVLASRAGKGAAVPELDAECLLDLQANGGK